jgi:EmrB/QacA subfamily drug resistance transporter
MNKSEKLIVLVAILSSLVAFLDGSIVNVALPAIQNQLGGGLVMQQWIVDAYLLTLGSFILIAGSLSDLFGRKRLLSWGLIGFGITSLACALAPNGTSLIIARALQGLFGALLVPSSLALIAAYVSEENFSYAIGQWTSWTGIAFVIGPLLGGYLTDSFSWRWIFGINVVPILITLYLVSKLKETARVDKHTNVDMLGAFFCALGLGSLVFGLIEQPHFGFTHPRVLISLILGITFLVLFFWREKTTSEPMLPLALFRYRNFTVGNLSTFLIYGGLSLVTFLLVIFLQQNAHYSALDSGLSLLPVTIILFILSHYAGRFSKKFGPRWFMGLGPILASVGIFFIGKFTSSEVSYWTQLFPAIVIFGIGLAATVAPLTSAILGEIDKSRSGIASAVNNAIARIAGLIAIAVIGTVAYSFSLSMYVTAGLLLAGGIISAIGITNKKHHLA